LTNVTSAFAGKTAGGASSTTGIITTAPDNIVEIVGKTTLSSIYSPANDKVYAKLTFAAGVWTLTYFTNISGTETAYSLPSQNIRILFREVFTKSSVPTIGTNPIKYFGNKNSSGAVASTPPTMDVILSGSGTYTVPAGATSIEVEIVGPGGGGAGSGENSTGGSGSNGSGSTTFGTLSVGPGSGSLGGNNSGGNGGTTSSGAGFSSYGFVGSKGDGGGHTSGTAGVGISGGKGGSSFFSGAGAGAPSGGNSGFNAQSATGSGGGGGSTTSSSASNYFAGSGGGSGGYRKAISTGALPASYSYSVGTGGAGGSAGTNGAPGGSGAGGIIIIKVNY